MAHHRSKQHVQPLAILSLALGIGANTQSIASHGLSAVALGQQSALMITPFLTTAI
jgi:hypothetical protein